MNKLNSSSSRLPIFILTLFLTGGISARAGAFTLVRSSTGKPVGGWASSDVTFDIDASCSSSSTAVNAAIDAAATVWNNVASSAIVVSRGSTVSLPSAITTYVGAGATSNAPRGNAIVYCDANFSANSGLSASSIPGFATGQNISSSGTIDGCLLVLNVQSGAAANVTTMSSSVVTTILAHEIGHCLGIGHSSDGEALMYYATSASRSANLARDDIDAISYLYPKQQVVSALPGCAPVASASEILRSKPNGKNPSQFARLLFEFWELMAIGAICIVVRFAKKKRRGNSLPNLS